MNDSKLIFLKTNNYVGISPGFPDKLDAFNSISDIELQFRILLVNQ